MKQELLVVKSRIKASFFHFLVSAVVVVTALLVVFFVWYPKPYDYAKGIWTMVKVLVCVDLVLGPMLMFVIYNKAKPLVELKRDIAIIALVQVSALFYGMYAMYGQRPAYVVFAIDRLEILSAKEVEFANVDNSVAGRPLIGPAFAYVLPAQSEAEKRKLTTEWVEGKGDLHEREERYRPIDRHINDIATRSLDTEKIIALFANKGRDDEAAKLRKHKAAAAGGAIYLPLKGQLRDLVIAIDAKDGKTLETFALDPWLPKEKSVSTMPDAIPPAPADSISDVPDMAPEVPTQDMSDTIN